MSGKWLFIDADEMSWSPMNNTFPLSKIAQTPAEVETIFLETRPKADPVRERQRKLGTHT